MRYPEVLLQGYFDRFVNRADSWYKQWVDHTGTAHYAYQAADMDTHNGRYIYEPVTLDLIARHLDCSLTASWISLSHSGFCKWCAWDSDHDTGDLSRVAAVLNRWGFASHTEGRRPGRAGHLWLFFDAPVTAADLLVFNREVLAHAGVLPTDIEFFPKSSDKLSQVRGPLGVNRKPEANGARGFFDEAPVTVQAQLEWLAEVQPDQSRRVANIASAIRARLPRPALRQKKQIEAIAGRNIIELVEFRRLGSELVAPCPMCRAEGHDRKGDNLRATNDGLKFCCVYGGPGMVHKSGDIRRRLESLA